MKDIKQIITNIIDSSKNLYDRQDICKMIILALVADESIFLYGPPGTAKSMVAKWAASILDTEKYFSCLLNQYTQPDELFGPVSIKALEEGRREVMTQGYMPEAEITFLDEIWKAGPAILNTLLTICNEKTFRNGNSVMEVPLKLLISASNEFPEEGSGLEALYDRFLIRMIVNPVSSKKDFYNLLTNHSKNEIEYHPITNKQLEEWRKGALTVSVRDCDLEFIYTLRNKLNKENVYISDRRWKKIIRLMMVSAYLNGRTETNEADYFVFDYTLWSRLEDQEIIEKCINECFAADIKEFEKYEKIETLVEDACKKMSKEEIEVLNKELINLPKEIKKLVNEKFSNILASGKCMTKNAAGISAKQQLDEFISDIHKKLQTQIKKNNDSARENHLKNLECFFKEESNEDVFGYLLKNNLIHAYLNLYKVPLPDKVKEFCKGWNPNKAPLKAKAKFLVSLLDVDEVLLTRRDLLIQRKLGDVLNPGYEYKLWFNFLTEEHILMSQEEKS